MFGNPKVLEMMKHDPTLLQRAEAARTNPNFMQLMGQDQSLGMLMIELMGLGDQFRQGKQPGQQQGMPQ